MAESKPKSKKAFKPPKRPTPERLANIALYHLDRYASSAENLRRVLQRRVFKASLHFEDLDIEQINGWIDDLIRRYERSGLLNDRAYAEVRARSLLARGNSQRQIRAKLLVKGLSADDIDLALSALEEDHADPEFSAAVKLAKRRRLGPYGDPSKRAEQRDKHLSALARAGFSYDMAQRVVDSETTQELEERLAPPPFTSPEA
jgi:regulatory protein